MFSNKNKDLQDSRIEPESSSCEDCPKKSIPLLVVSLMGLLVAFLSGFHETIPFAGSLCSTACADTARMHFLHIPFWLWGALFYLGAAALAFFNQKSVAWISFAAAGVEAVLVLLMIWMQTPCVFCIANAAVLVVLLAVSFRKELVWQQATLALLFFVGFLFWVPYENNLQIFSPKNDAVNDRYDSGIAATVGGENITNQRLDVLLGSRLQQMRSDIYQMKMQRLDQLVIDTILDKEAKKQGKTLDQLISGLTGSVKVSDAEVDKYMQEHRQQLQVYAKTMPDLKQRIKQGLEEQKKTMAVNAYAHAHEAQYGVRVFVAMPHPPKVTIDIAGAPALGPKNAPVTVIEFSDYECPACRANHKVVQQVRAAFGDKLRWIYKEYPLHVHPLAFKAAEAGLCAEDQGKFWQYQNDLYTTPDLAVPNLIAMAAKLGMSGKQFSECLNSSKYKAMVQKSISDAVRAGIDRTPTYVIDGTVFIGGPSLDTFERVIGEELKEKGIRPQVAGKTK
ncbi:MAG: thioredoxin domain-containing protein [Syntrophobacteraceae bacterium]|nr:thioredoxin domain-containing protein [Syntrophobacteraceae bacterium]